MKFVIALLLASTPVGASSIAELAWLSGCWSYDGREAGSGEVWMPPAGGTVFAMSRIEGVSAGKSIAMNFPMTRVNCEALGQ